MLFSVVENHIAIVVACAPSIKFVALLIFPKLTSSLGKLASRITPTPSFPSWSTRSRTRTSTPIGKNDLESGPLGSKNQTTKHSVATKGDDLGGLKVAPGQPSPAYNVGSGSSRTSRGFSRWFDRNPRQGGAIDSKEDVGLVYVEHSFSVERSAKTPPDQ